MAININAGDSSWDDKLTSGPALPEGRHVVFISAANCGKSKQKGTPFVELAFFCHDPRSKHNGAELKFQYFYLSDGAMPRFVRLLRACGATTPFDAGDATQVADNLLDRLLVIKVEKKTEEYEGKKRDKTEVAQFDSLTAEDKASLFEEYGETMLPPAETTDDEIPF